MSQYDAKIIYVKGGDNTVADVLSCLPCNTTTEAAENIACHLYDYCHNDEGSPGIIARIFSMVGNNPQNSAKVLSYMPECIAVNATLNISADKQLLQQIKEGYENDSWCKRLPAATASWPELHLKDGLWYMGSRLTIPRTKSLC